jgi:hypothetical protein
VRNLPVKLSKHALARLKKRFKLNKEAAQRFAENVLKNGTIICDHMSKSKIDASNNDRAGCITIVHNGHTHIFAPSKDNKSGEDVILLVTSCNDDKSSEWTHFHHGERRQYAATKRSKINRGTPANKYTDLKHVKKDSQDFDGYCA